MNTRARLDALEQFAAAEGCAVCGLLPDGFPPAPVRFAPIVWDACGAQVSDASPSEPCPACGVRPFRFRPMKLDGGRQVFA